MTVPVVTAVPGSSWETALVAALEHEPRGVTVVRRCVDVADLLATASSGLARAVLVASDLRRFDREAVARLHAAGVGVVGVCAPGDDDGERRLRALGVPVVVAADSATELIASAVLEAVSALPSPAERSRHFSLPLGTLERPERDEPVAGSALAEAVPLRRGRLVAVWGPAGSPGRTSLAVNLAAELAALDLPVLLADLDTYAASVAQTLGLLDEAAGLASAARLANTGALDLTQLARLATVVMPNLRVLTGLPRSERWPELRPAALDSVWQRCRELAEVTLIDCAFCLEQQEEISFDVAAPRRNGATLAALARADTVVAVGAGDPVGLARLVRGLGDLREIVPGAHLIVVVNRVRSSVLGARPEEQVTRALREHAGVETVRIVPDDRAAFDVACRDGRALLERVPSSPARHAIQQLAHELVGMPARRARSRERRAQRHGAPRRWEAG